MKVFTWMSCGAALANLRAPSNAKADTASSCPRHPVAVNRGYFSCNEKCDVCLDPGEDRRTYSSVYDDNPIYARSQIDSDQAWSAKTIDENQFVILDLEKVTNLTGLILQGRKGEEFTEYVQGYLVSVSEDATNWRLLATCFNAYNEPTKNMFPEVESARYVKISPTRWHSHISMRVSAVVQKLCAGSYCKANEYVKNNLCLRCPPGTYHEGIAHASGLDTSCNDIYCARNERVHNHRCHTCRGASTHAASANAAGGNTRCLGASVGPKVWLLGKR